MNLQEKIAFFERHHYLIIPNALTPAEVAMVNKVIDCQKGDWGTAARVSSATCLTDAPEYDFLIRHPSFFPVAQHAFDNDIVFSEFSIMIRSAGPEARGPDGWHNDFAPNPAHRLGFHSLSAIYYTTDVDKTTARYVLIPASQYVGEKPKKIREDGEEREGEVEILGPAGSVVLVNSGNWHTGRWGTAPRERRTIHLYFQQSTTAPVSPHTPIPRRLWDSPDPELRRFYGHHNEVTKAEIAKLRVGVS